MTTHLRLTRIREEGKPNAVLVSINSTVYINDDYETVVIDGHREWHVEESFEDVAAMLHHVDDALFRASNEGRKNTPLAA